MIVLYVAQCYVNCYNIPHISALIQLGYMSKGYNRPPRAYRGSRGIALLILDLSARRGWGQHHTPPALFRERPGTHCTGGWVGPRAGLDVCEKSRPHMNSIPGPSSLSLYRLSYLAHIIRVIKQWACSCILNTNKYKLDFYNFFG
jgi:hypothetical protein